MRPRDFGALAMFVLLMSNTGALAEPSEVPLLLSYEPALGCPTRAAVVSEVRRLARLSEPTERRVKASISVTSEGPDRFLLELVSEFEGAPGERVLEGQSCKSVVDAAALILALMLNPDAASDPDPASDAEMPGPQPRATTAESPGPRAPDLTREPPRERERGALRVGPALTPSFEAGASAGARSGALPSLVFEPGLLARVGLDSFGMSLDARYLPAQQHRFDDSEPAGGRLWAFSAGAALGYLAPFGDVRVGPQLGVEVTRVEGRGVAVSDPRVGRILWASLRLGADAGLFVTSAWVVQASVQGLFPLARPSVFLEEIGVVHRPERLGGRAGLAVSYLWR